MATKDSAVFVFSVCFVAVFNTFVNEADCRAVNISNTWLLPEDYFPVFYRFFKDQVSWDEADTVCKFHHARLVTVDTSEQFDASRAFLKELDVVQPIWLGLKSLKKPASSSGLSAAADHTFLWTNEVPLSGPGFWRQPPSSWLSADNTFCAVTDPAADFRWTGLPCRGPAAAFICEMPVPDWARSKDGCLLTSLPSLSVAFLPEKDAIELTADCGLEGTRKVTCKGQANREEMMKQLTCDVAKETDTLPSDDDDTSKTPASSSASVSPSSPPLISVSSNLSPSPSSPSLSSSSPFSAEDSSASASPSSGNTAEPVSKISTINTWATSDGTPTRSRRDTDASLGTTPTSTSTVQPSRNITGNHNPDKQTADKFHEVHIIPVVPKKGQHLWTKKPDLPTLDRVTIAMAKPGPAKTDVDDKEDMMIVELSDTNTPLQSTKTPIIPLSPSTGNMKEQLVTLVLPSTEYPFKPKPVKKTGVSAGTTSTTKAPETDTPATTTDDTQTTIKRLAHQFESMAGPGGKSRTLTTTTSPGIMSSASAASTTITTTLSSSTSTATTSTTSTTTTPQPTTSTTSTTTPQPITTETSTTSTSTTASPDKKRHLPGPLMSMSLQSINFAPPSGGTGSDNGPRSDEGDHSALVDDADAPSRPNRGRLLFRPHQHVFYPYFFNRALGR